MYFLIKNGLKSTLCKTDGIILVISFFGDTVGRNLGKKIVKMRHLLPFTGDYAIM